MFSKEQPSSPSQHFFKPTKKKNIEKNRKVQFSVFYLFFSPFFMTIAFFKVSQEKM